MDGDSATATAAKPRHFFQFSLSMSLALMTGICCYLAGYARGQSAAALTMTSMCGTSTKTYDVDDLVIDPKSNDPQQADFDSLTTKIRQRCTPESWEASGGPGKIIPVLFNFHLDVTANDVVHTQIEGLLATLRAEKFGPKYKFWPGHFAINAKRQWTYGKSYVVVDLITHETSRSSQEDDYDELVAKIEQQCTADTWEKQGGAGRITPFLLNDTLIVEANHFAHNQIAELLEQMRTEKRSKHLYETRTENLGLRPIRQ